jgi:hypothetical protein
MKIAIKQSDPNADNLRSRKSLAGLAPLTGAGAIRVPITALGLWFRARRISVRAPPLHAKVQVKKLQCSPADIVVQFPAVDAIRIDAGLWPRISSQGIPSFDFPWSPTPSLFEASSACATLSLSERSSDIFCRKSAFERFSCHLCDGRRWIPHLQKHCLHVGKSQRLVPRHLMLPSHVKLPQPYLIALHGICLDEADGRVFDEGTGAGGR